MAAVAVGSCVATPASMADVKDLAGLESEEDESEKGSRKLHKQLVRARTSLLIFRRWVNRSFAASEVGNNGVEVEKRPLQGKIRVPL